MKVARCIPMFAGALALVVTSTAYASGTSTSATPAAHATSHSTSTAKSTAPAASHTAASTAPSDEHLAAVRQTLAQSRHNLRGYHWKETIVASLKGEDKSTMMNSCVYDATGKVVRTPEPVPANSQMNGVRGATPAAEKAELQTYEHSAVALMRSYVPPDPMKLEKDQRAGKMTSNTEGDRVRLTFKDYQKPGDVVTFELNPMSNQILSLSVRSYLASAKDAVTMNVDMASLPDGTSYPAKVRLDTPAKQMGVTVTNSDYQKKTS